MRNFLLTEADDKELITLTPEWMERRFNEMNRLLFNNMLGYCKFSIFTTGKGSSGSVLGWFKTRVTSNNIIWRYQRNGKQAYIRNYNDDEVSIDEEDFSYYFNPEIQLNGNYRWTEKAALSTLVHEMCHFRQHMFGFWEGRGTRGSFTVIHHGPTFMRVAEAVSAKSNEFFTVDKIASAEQIKEMDFTDEIKEKNAKSASKGIHFFKFELTEEEIARDGKSYRFCYAIPSATIFESYYRTLPTYDQSRYKKILHCITTDGTIKQYHTVSTVGRWYYTAANSIEDILPQVRVDWQEEINLGTPTDLSEPWYLFKMKYKNPQIGSKSRKYYTYAYHIIKPKEFYRFRNFIENSKDKFEYAAYCEVYDPKILEKKYLKDYDVNYLTTSMENILPNIKQGQDVVLFGETETKQPKPNNSANSQWNKAQEEKRYSFEVKIRLNDGSLTSLVVNNATEDEAKEQLRRRFPKWSEDVIDAKFRKYALGQ